MICLVGEDMFMFGLAAKHIGHCQVYPVTSPSISSCAQHISCGVTKHIRFANIKHQICHRLVRRVYLFLNCSFQSLEMQYFAGKQNWKNVQKILYPNIFGGIYFIPQQKGTKIFHTPTVFSSAPALTILNDQSLKPEN